VVRAEVPGLAAAQPTTRVDALDRSQPFYGYNRPGAKISEGVRESFWLQGMLAGFPAAYFCIKAFSETDFTEDLQKFDVPTLIMHGDAVPVPFLAHRRTRRPFSRGLPWPWPSFNAIALLAMVPKS
jgi:pimeloyl-ACP methyl ester carboxylesterase